MVVFLSITMQSLLHDEDVWLGQIRIMAHKSHNFLSDCWIALKFLQEFPGAVFLGAAMELLLDDEEV